MNLNRLYLPFLVSIVLTGIVCKSGDTGRDDAVRAGASTATTPDTVAAAASPAPPPGRADITAVRANVSRVTATVRTVDPVDSIAFRLTVRIDSVFTVGEMASLAQPGQELTLEPRLIQDLNGKVDRSSDRNQRLMDLRTLQPGSTFRGKVSMMPAGVWLIVDAGD